MSGKLGIPPVRGREPPLQPRWALRSARGEASVKVLAAVLLGLSSILVAAAQRQEQSTLLVWIVKTTAFFAVAYGVWQLGNSLMRRRVGQWREPALRPHLQRELCLVSLLVLLGVGGLLAPATPVVALALAAACIVVGYVNDLLQGKIARFVEADPQLRSVTDWIGSRRPAPRAAFNDESIAAAGVGADATLVQRFLGWCYSKPPGQIISRLRLAASGALLVLAVVAGGAGGVGIAREWLQDASEPTVQRRSAGTDAVDRQRGGKPRTRSPVTPPARPLSVAAETWISACGPNAEPGDGAPEPWAEQVLYALYLGEKDLSSGGGRDLPTDIEPPGAAGGCTGHVLAPDGSTHFYYTFGTILRTGETRSVAVASQRFPSAIFIAPAVEPVLDLIDRYGEIGGLPRLDVGRGDCQAAQTAGGMVMLVRTEKTASGGGGVAYLVLPLAVTQAWWQAMVERGGQWLWPRLASESGSTTTFHLGVYAIGDDSVTTILYDERSGIATRSLSPGTREYGPEGVTFSLPELKALAETAR